MALGSTKGQVLRLVLREGIVLVAVGTVLGLLGAIVMSRGLSALTDIFTQAFQTGASDPRLLIGAPLLLAGLAMLACYIPRAKIGEDRSAEGFKGRVGLEGGAASPNEASCGHSSGTPVRAPGSSRSAILRAEFGRGEKRRRKLQNHGAFEPGVPPHAVQDKKGGTIYG